MSQEMLAITELSRFVALVAAYAISRMSCCYRWSGQSVCVSVSVLLTTMTSAKMTEPIDGKAQTAKHMITHTAVGFLFPVVKDIGEI